MSKVLIVGGGAAGMFCAVIAAGNGHEVLLFEKNEKLGKKLYITGKGRCNLTNACDMEELFNSIITNKKFLFSAFNKFNNYDTIDLFNKLGLKTKIERGNRVFPESDKSSDVISVLLNEIKRLGVVINYNSEVESIIASDNVCKGIILKNKQKIFSDYVIVATGGLSYKSTGSTGDGYKFAKDLGHNITELYPALVPFNIKEGLVKDLQGLSLRNVKITVTSDNKEIFSDFGELLFTHFGVSGPTILSASSFIIPYLKNKNLILSIDLKPALTQEQLDARIIRDFENYKNKQFKNALDDLFPSKLIPVIIQLSGINPDKKVNVITKEERLKLVDVTKNFRLNILSLRDYNEAVITRGGILVKEINPQTMESKLVKNIFFIGEVLDIDGLTGGFNLQIAWSSAYMAAISIS